jgi:hypothetical protein
MASWADLEREAPAVAAGGREALYRSGEGEGMFTTILGDGLPRTHVVNVGIVGGRLLVFVQGRSAKTRDLLGDGRYALHAMQDPAVPHEFLVRGRARPVTDDVVRAAAKAVWAFTPADDYPLFELEIEHALFGERGDPDAWPPQYTSWKPGQAATHL